MNKKRPLRVLCKVHRFGQTTNAPKGGLMSSQKYHASPTPGNSSVPGCSPIITNDLFLAAFLSTVGCTLDRIEKNERRRVSFVFVGDRCRELREAYRTGPVHLDIRSFRENLNRLRDRLGTMVAETHPEDRSTAAYGRTRKTPRRNIPAYPHR